MARYETKPLHCITTTVLSTYNHGAVYLPPSGAFTAARLPTAMQSSDVSQTQLNFVALLSSSDATGRNLTYVTTYAPQPGVS